MHKAYPAWIDEYAEAYRSSFLKHDVKVHMPFNGWDFFPIFADLWVEKISATIHEINQNGLKIDDLADRLPNHASMKFGFSMTLFCMNIARTPAPVVRTICDFFIASINAQTAGAPLWMNNKIHAYENVSRVISDKKLVVADRERASEIGKIVTGCGTLGHGLYNDFHVDTTYDVYGPYSTTAEYGEGTSLLVKVFEDLNPTELWPTHTPFPFREIKIFNIYQGVELIPTFVACQMLSNGNLLDSLKYFQVEVDGRFVNSLVELKEVRNTLLKAASELYVEFIELGFEKKKELWLYQMGYQLKRLFDLAEHDWRPSEEMKKRVQGKDLIPTVSSYEVPQVEFYQTFGIQFLKEVYA